MNNVFSGSVTKRVEFDAAHRLPLHQGKCAHLHGHRYVLVVEVRGPIDEATGMLVDYGDISDALKQYVHGPLDHGTMVWARDYELLAWLERHAQKHVVFAMPPTAEAIAAWAFAGLRAALFDAAPGAAVSTVTVHETPTSSATYPG